MLSTLHWPVPEYEVAQAQQHRIVELETLLANAESRLAQSQGAQRASQQGVDELRQELENNAGACCVTRKSAAVLDRDLIHVLCSGVQDALQRATGEGRRDRQAEGRDRGALQAVGSGQGQP